MAITWNPISDWDNEGWRDQARCRQADASLFFPAGSTGAGLGQISAAKAVCRACPVQGPCLRFALDTNQESGIWGGKDEQERRSLRSVGRSDRR